MKKWIVQIDSGCFMAGIHRFKTKVKAQEFLLAWLKATTDDLPTMKVRVYKESKR